MFSDLTTTGQVYKFNDSIPNIWSLERSNSHYPPLPSLYRIIYGEPVWDKINLTAPEALDLVQEKLYPMLKKVEHPYTKEIMDNYSAILAYEVPDYSYVGDNEFMLYIGQSDTWSEVPYHRINVYNFNTKQSKTILVNDVTGEISTEGNNN